MARLRVGVVGLDRRWRAALRPEARAVTGEGIIELLRRPGIDAIILGRAWFGLWPLPHAIEAGKPVLCLADPLADEAVLDEIAGRDAGIRYEPWPSLGLVERSLGMVGEPLRLQASCTGLPETRLLALLGFVGRLLGEAPSMRKHGPCLALDHDSRKRSLFLLGEGPEPSCHLRIEGEGGSVSVEMPSQLSWRDGAGRQERSLPSSLARSAVLEAFLADVRAGRPMGGIGPALGWLRQARG
ncbi:MAG: hypothetical protein K2W96_15845 [Gemmataceae bacterium]|nr:hypothetical protein [Gemmataceae bacterium]